MTAGSAYTYTVAWTTYVLYIHRVHPIALPRAMNYNVNVLYISCYHGNHVHDSVSEHFCVCGTCRAYSVGKVWFQLIVFWQHSLQSDTHTHTGPMWSCMISAHAHLVCMGCRQCMVKRTQGVQGTDVVPHKWEHMCRPWNGACEQLIPCSIYVLYMFKRGRGVTWEVQAVWKQTVSTDLSFPLHQSSPIIHIDTATKFNDSIC